MDFQEIIPGTVGKENTFGLVKPEPMSFVRLSTEDISGGVRGYIGEGRFSDDPLNTFGGAGVVEIPNLRRLLRFICERVLNTLWPPICQQLPRQFIRRPLAISVGTCTGTTPGTEPADIVEAGYARREASFSQGVFVLDPGLITQRFHGKIIKRDVFGGSAHVRDLGFWSANVYLTVVGAAWIVAEWLAYRQQFIQAGQGARR